MDYDLVCFRDGSKATKSLVGLFVSQIKMMSVSPDGWPVLLHLLEICQHQQGTSKQQFSAIHLKRLVSFGILIKRDGGYDVHPIFRHVLLEAERQNNIYTVVYNKLVYNQTPEEPADEGPEDEEEEAPQIYGPPPLFKQLKFDFVYYNSRTGRYSDLEYKPDAEFDIPAAVRGFINTLGD